MLNNYFVYIMASKRNGTLYVGMTNSLLRRVCDHKEGRNEGFTKKYHIHTLVYYEEGSDVNAVIRREKQLKKWNRAWKIRLIEQHNPTWRDLYPDLLGDNPVSPPP